jgi:hypothetical protein
MFNLIILLAFTAAVLNIMFFERESTTIEEDLASPDVLHVVLKKGGNDSQKLNSESTSRTPTVLSA